MKNTIYLLSVVLISLFCKSDLMAKTVSAPEEALIARIVPNHASKFSIEIKPSTKEDWFEIESKGDKIVLRGNNGVSVASALYYYLNEYTHNQITWNGTNLNLPKKLPAVPKLIHKKTPYEYRYYLNYCTFNYSMSWWDWKRWEKEIDWMALHGINMPLALTGEEYIWDEVYRLYGFTDEDLNSFFSGPAYFSWFWMGNLDAWGGPLSKNWKESHRDLQLKILKRERELGMKTVLPAFTGHVPASFKKVFPNAKLKKTSWVSGFGDVYILDPEDPLFAEIGKKFLEMQTKIYGTDHLYSADTFNENTPPSNDPAYLSDLSKRVFEGMKAADKDAVWVMQGWLFYHHKKFWKAPQIKGLLGAVPDDRMIVLDLAADIEPVWKRTEAFYGKQWIWNMLHNFGGNIATYGAMEKIANEPAKALADSNKGKLKGIGLTMEAIEQNPVMYELMTANIWRDTPIDLNSWITGYTLNRYGKLNADITKAWGVLMKTVYNEKMNRDGDESILVSRPTFDGSLRWGRNKLNYDPIDLLPAWDYFIKSIPAYQKSDGFQYDLVDVTRQSLANYALSLLQQVSKDYQANDKVAFDTHSKEFLELIDDVDMLLASRQDFLLGPWIANARSWGVDEKEKALYEQNARDLITLWGGPDNTLHEYSNRQWSGLLTDFYKPRWQQFFTDLKADWGSFNQADFDKKIKQWEWKWVTARKDFPVKAKGNPNVIAKALHEKYRSRIIPMTKQIAAVK